VWTWARRVGLTLLVLVVLVFAVSGAYLGWDRLSPEQLDVVPPGFDVDAAGVRTHVEHWPAARPSGKAPLVLVPGFAESTYVWSRVAPLLAADRDVYAYDVRGYGFTDRVPPYDLASDTDQLVGLIAALGLERPIVVGHSSGVAIALSLALRAPESVTASSRPTGTAPRTSGPTARARVAAPAGCSSTRSRPRSSPQRCGTAPRSARSSPRSAGPGARSTTRRSTGGARRSCSRGPSTR
jgi:pimeloyl-ACP methyl ester carboxylesterase